MSTEFGIFNDEGLLEGDFYTEASAHEALRVSYAADGAHVGVICPDHPEYEYEGCEECNAEDEEDES